MQTESAKEKARRPYPKKRRKPFEGVSFSYALKSFFGYLEGSKKSANTISSYRSDLQTFQEFFSSKRYSNRPFDQLSSKVLSDYSDFLKAEGFRTNTRRRKLLTLRRFLKHLSGRNKLQTEMGHRLPAPHKVERVPETVSLPDLLKAIQALSTESQLERRNRLILWVLAETGCQVSEIRTVSIEGTKKKAVFSVGGKAPRSLPMSVELFSELSDFKKSKPDSKRPLFEGYNKFGPMGDAISSRGVELLVKAYRGRLGQGRLVPRTFRHSAVLEWYQQGTPREEIQRRLGLQTPYAFRVFEPLFRQVDEKKSKPEPA